jgi:hypothetical protein
LKLYRCILVRSYDIILILCQVPSTIIISDMLISIFRQSYLLKYHGFPSIQALNISQNGVFGGKTKGPRISSRFSRPHNSSTSVRAKGNVVPGPRLQEENDQSTTFCL